MSRLFRPPDEVVVYVASEAAKRNGYSNTKTKEARIKSMIQAFNKTGAVELMIRALVVVEKEQKQ